MKRLNYIAGFVCALLLFSGCTNWLENAKSRGETSDKEAYEQESGFEAVLAGAYNHMASTNLYGKNITMHIPEYLVRHWTTAQDNTDGRRLSDYDLDEMRTNESNRKLIADTWNQFYTTIAQLNSLIAALEVTDIKFSGDNKDIILGEARGLRAFLHLDLLRFFGPIPSDGIANSSNLYLPYVTKLTTNAEDLKPASWDDYIWQLRQDLGASQLLLSDIDPIDLYSQEGVEGYGGTDDKNPLDEFQTFRKRRFNYWAAVATEARLESWLLNPERAAELAKSVIEARSFDNHLLFPLESDGSTTANNRTMNRENIFYIHNPDLYPNIEDLYLGTLAGTSGTQRNIPNYGIEEDPVRRLFNNRTDDWRGGLKYWVIHKNTTSEIPILQYLKYVNDLWEENRREYLNRVPVIRAGEMYLLVFEGMDTSTGFAKDALETFLVARGLTETKSITDAMLFDKMRAGGPIEMEYHKEFQGEGQMFYFYKRNEYREYTWPVARTLNNYKQFYNVEIPQLNYWDFYFPKN